MSALLLIVMTVYDFKYLYALTHTHAQTVNTKNTQALLTHIHFVEQHSRARHVFLHMDNPLVHTKHAALRRQQCQHPPPTPPSSLVMGTVSPRVERETLTPRSIATPSRSLVRWRGGRLAMPPPSLFLPEGWAGCWSGGGSGAGGGEEEGG